MTQYPGLDKLQIQHAQLNACTQKKEVSHLCRDLMRLEAMKKDQLCKKEEAIRKSLYAFPHVKL